MKFLICAIVVIFSAQTAITQASEFPDKAYVNGKIYTVNESQTWAEAVAIKDGKFVAVGSVSEIEAVTGMETEVINLEGRFVMPGMIDVHTHAIDAHLPSVIRLSDGNDVDKILEEVRTYIESHPDQLWNNFGDFGFGLFPGDNGPKELLDEISTTQAIAIQHASGHAFWVNSKALELAGITKDTEDPLQGIIARKENREPAGGLQESAMKLVWEARGPFSDEDVRGAAEYANDLFASHGITATREAGMIPERYSVLLEMANAGELTTRYSMAAHWNPTVALSPPQDKVLAWVKDNLGNGDDILKLDSLKIIVDGVPASYTAYLKEPYAGRPDSTGWKLVEDEDINSALIEYDALGVPVIFHVLGDAATAQALNAVTAAREANGVSNLPHHLSHTIIVDPLDIPRFGELDVVVDFSPFFAYPGPHHTNHVEAVGEEALQAWYPVRSIIEQGVKVALATDYPVDDLNPFVHMESAHTRMHPYGAVPGTLGADQAISREDAIKAYTLNPAHILGWDEKIGSIEIGKYADMVVLDANLLEVDAADISEVRVMKTLLAGEVIFDSSKHGSSLEFFEDSRLLAYASMKYAGKVCTYHNLGQLYLGPLLF